MSKLERFARQIDTINEVIGRLFSFLLLLLMGIVTMEVIARYIFNRPTIWGWVLALQIFGAITVVGGAYAHLHNMHVTVDVVVEHLPPRFKALLNLFTSALFFFFIGVLLWQGSTTAWESLKTRESYTSIWQPPIYPLKMLIPVAVFLLLLQGIARFMRDLISFMNPER
jgi:TRAP-type mannitol/chloroaromatic compound transport system permease small subunit